MQSLDWETKLVPEDQDQEKATRRSRRRGVCVNTHGVALKEIENRGIFKATEGPGIIGRKFGEVLHCGIIYCSTSDELLLRGRG